MQKIMNISCKTLDNPGRILRFIASDEAPDRDNDIVRVKGWELSHYAKNPVVLWAHSYALPPMGKCVNIVKTDRELIVDTKFPTLEEMCSDISHPSDHALLTDTVYNLYRGGYMNAVSVGFQPLDYKIRDDEDALKNPEWQRGCEIFRQDLYEYSLVPVPANPNALIQAKQAGYLLTGNDELTMVEKMLFGKKGGSLSVSKSGRRLSSSTLSALGEVRKCHDDMKKYSGSISECHKIIDELMTKLMDEREEEEEEPKEDTGKNVNTNRKSFDITKIMKAF